MAADLSYALATNLSRPFGLRLGAQVDRALYADIVEVVVKETPRRAFAAEVKHVEKVIIGGEPAERIEMRAEAVEHDAMHVDAAIFPRANTARQLALIDQARNELDGAVFGNKR
jgi:hypothetical protein